MNTLFCLFISFPLFCGASNHTPPNVIDKLIDKTSIKHKVPKDIINSIAIVESGKHPWVLNVCGKGEYYNSEKEALLRLNNIKKGCHVDIGIMQINWYWHGWRFNDIKQALDPITNLDVSMKILKEQYKESQGWGVAIGKYHSPSNPQLADKYRIKILKAIRK